MGAAGTACDQCGRRGRRGSIFSNVHDFSDLSLSYIPANTICLERSIVLWPDRVLKCKILVSDLTPYK